MRKQIAAANWKMNLDYAEAGALLEQLDVQAIEGNPDRYVLLAVPYPYLLMAAERFANNKRVIVAAQNCHYKDSGAYTGEVSPGMIRSVHAGAVIIGHSERREYNHESNEQLAEKITAALKHELLPVFCCGEALQVREAGTQNEFVAKQLEDSLYHLTEAEMQQIVIAYEPIWAIGTGKTATSEQAQEMHAFIRQTIEKRYSAEIANTISILYGGSVKGANAKEIFSQPDVDGGLVGGASLNAAEFATIISSLK